MSGGILNDIINSSSKDLFFDKFIFKCKKLKSLLRFLAFRKLLQRSTGNKQSIAQHQYTI